MPITSLVDIIRTWGVDTPDAPMLSLEDTTLTYGDVLRRAGRVAHALRDAGVGAQDRVAFIDKNSLEYFELLFGGALVNAVNVAVNWRLAPAEMAYIVNDSEAKVLVVHEEFAGHLDEMLPELTGDPHVVVIGSSDGHTTWDAWLEGRDETDPGEVPAADDVALQLYTSGTTGLPKGAQLTNANLVANLADVDIFGIDRDTVSLVAMPLFHIGGSGWALAGLALGAHDIVVRELDPVRILQLMSEKRITEAFLVPAALQFMLICPTDGLDFSSMRTMFYGASPISEEVLVGSMKQLGCGFAQVYGLTETTGVVTVLAPDDHDPGGPRQHLLRSAGAPLDNVEVRIVDTDSGDTLPDGEVGEVWIRGPQVMKGYWKLEDATASALPGEGWFRSGDAGYLQDGYLYIHDRVKDMIISGGENIYPAEVENVLMGLEGIADVAVIGVPDEKWGETPKAVVVLAEGAELTEAAIIEHCRSRIARFKCPTSVDFAEAIPRNPTGKILKRELRAPYWEGRDRAVN